MRELFIYYHVPGDKAAQAGPAVRDMQSRLRAEWPMLQARLLLKIGAVDAMQTWMETYAMPAESGGVGIGADLQTRIASAALALAPFIEGLRHVEAFAVDASA